MSSVSTGNSIKHKYIFPILYKSDSQRLQKLSTPVTALNTKH